MDWTSLAAGIAMLGLSAAAFATAFGLIAPASDMNALLIGLHAAIHAYYRASHSRNGNGDKH